MLVQNNGLVVCQPSPQKAVQQIAPFVGEKDSSVRNAALNTLVIFYENMGDAIYKHVGRVSPCFPSPPLLLPLTPHTTLYCCLPPTLLPSSSHSPHTSLLLQSPPPPLPLLPSPPPLLLPLTSHTALYCCLPPLSSPPLPSPPLPSPRSIIRISPCSKSRSTDQPRSLLLRPTPQSPYKRSSPLPTPRGRGRGRRKKMTNPHRNRRVEPRVWHPNKGVIWMLMYCNKRYSTLCGPMEEVPFPGIVCYMCVVAYNVSSLSCSCIFNTYMYASSVTVPLQIAHVYLLPAPCLSAGWQ